MIAHYGCFEDVSVVIDACLLCNVSCAACLSFEVDHLLMVNLCYVIKGLLLVHWFSLNQKIVACTGQNLSLTTSHLFYCIPRILALGTNDLAIGTPFAKKVADSDSLALQSTMQCAGHDSCGYYGFFNLASASVDGCYLYIIIHYGRSQRNWGIRLAPRGGRPNPEFFKTIDNYTYSKKSYQ